VFPCSSAPHLPLPYPPTSSHNRSTNSPFRCSPASAISSSNIPLSILPLPPSILPLSDQLLVHLLPRPGVGVDDGAGGERS